VINARVGLQDIALLTGGKALMEGLDIQLKNIQISDLGQAKKVTIGKNRTVIESQGHTSPTLQSCTAKKLSRS